MPLRKLFQWRYHIYRKSVNGPKTDHSPWRCFAMERQMKRKRKILFVDDEPIILRGLKRLLAGMNKHWEMYFVRGGEIALKQIDEQEFDIVISDMNMPEINGVQLLKYVKNHSPNTLRIILSSDHDLAPTAFTGNVVHHHINKPCDAKTLESAIIGHNPSPIINPTGVKYGLAG
jgi:CheY-like chemotaxis protein